ncbi:MAG TPA: hypothetical protein VH600_05230 [Burkholderiales bacterium]|jgi:hypothetical protein
MKALLLAARTAAPYLLVEIVLPGGTLIAIAMWLMSDNGKATTSQALLWMRRITGSIPSLSR